MIINDNTGGNGQNNTFLQQAGYKKCILDAKHLDHNNSKIGVTSDYHRKVTFVYNASNQNPFFGDKGRGIYESGSDIRFERQ